VTVNAGESKEANLALAAEAPPKDESRAPASEEGPSDDEDDESPSSRGTGEREPFLHWVTTSPAGVIPAGATVLFGLGAGGFAIASNLSYRDADDVGQQIEDNARQDMAQTRGVCTDPRAVLMQANYPSDVNARAAQYQAACAEHADSTERGDSFKTFAIVSGIGAGVLAVTTIVSRPTNAHRCRRSISPASYRASDCCYVLRAGTPIRVQPSNWVHARKSWTSRRVRCVCATIARCTTTGCYLPLAAACAASTSPAASSTESTIYAQ
jgi:hypothetical protein